jgi:hypothetical protein
MPRLFLCLTYWPWSDQDDTYTYNKRVGRLSAVQDHKMMIRGLGFRRSYAWRRGNRGPH